MTTRPLYNVIATTLRAAENNPSDDEYALLEAALVAFVAAWMTENGGPDIDGLIARWCEEMLNGNRPG